MNTPRLITNQVGQAVWRFDNTDPFGGNPPDENPSGLGTFTCNLRLPGQYFDKETNLHYNWNRWYDSAIGGYIQPEPLGLAGDINLYRYARNNPLTYFDPDGRQATMPLRPVPPGGSAGSGSGGKKPVPVFPEGFDLNPKPPQGVPIITPLEPPPQAPRPPGTGCSGVFEACMRSAQVCPIALLRGALYGVCFTAWLICEATQ